MKKGKVFTKSHMVVALMVVALGAAVWLNMKFSSSEKYLGEATYVSNEDSAVAVETAAKADATDYFKTAKKERQENMEEIEDFVNDTLDSEKLTEAEKNEAVKKVADLASRLEKENNIETLLKAKGFDKAMAVIGDKNINIVVSSEGLTTAQTLQIQDIVTSETEIALGNIKIVTVK